MRRLPPSPEQVRDRWLPLGVRKNQPSGFVPSEIRRDERQLDLDGWMAPLSTDADEVARAQQVMAAPAVDTDSTSPDDLAGTPTASAMEAAQAWAMEQRSGNGAVPSAASTAPVDDRQAPNVQETCNRGTTQSLG